MKYAKTDVEKFAAEHGLRVVYPAANQLQIDIDSNEDMLVFEKNFKILLEVFPLALFRSSPSRSKPEGRHITVTLPRAITALERIAYQATLGSDRVRELLSLKDLEKGLGATTCLFEKA